MNEDIQPIFDFAPLKRFLTNKGYIVEKAQGYKEINPEEVTMNSIQKGEMEFEANGIYVILPNGTKQQVFLYKRDYHLQLYGKPRFHICKSSTINEFIQSGSFRQHYVRANTDPVPVNNIDNNYKEENVSDLPLCRFCLNQISEYGDINTKAFVELLKQAKGEEEEEIQEVDIFGYVRDWEQISRDYREKKNYTCEICGLQIDNFFDRQYMHCHHKDANKLNNKESNLQCLCMRCHSKIDQIHYKNLTTGANRILFNEFNELYPEKK